MDKTEFLIIAAIAIWAISFIATAVFIIKKSSKGGFDGQVHDDIKKLHGMTSSGLNGLNQTVTTTGGQILSQIGKNGQDMLRQQLDMQQKLFLSLNDQKEQINKTLKESIGAMQQSNEQKLDQMRQTVDEKMQKTLNERLDSSFKTVSEQLEKLYRSMGEMKNLSDGVNDLQRLLTNVKARGTWAEVQLGEILEQFLTCEQFERNVSTKSNSDFVEYAVKIPSKKSDGEFIYLPIDSKFPQEDYLRLQKAAEDCDKQAVEASEKALENVIKTEAAKISRSYINVPVTTDFAIMFLPTEGLYAEVLRRPGLIEEIQRKYSIMICGPTTISAFLNTLRVGFRTIAIDKQQAEVWKILGAAKQQYEMFEAVLDKAERKISEAGSVIGDAKKRNGIIQKKLRAVESTPDESSGEILGIE